MVALLLACALISDAEVDAKVGVVGTDETDTDVDADVDTHTGDTAPEDTAPEDTAPEDTDTPTDTDNGDADADGYTVAEGDCDDSDASVHPAASETCATEGDDDCDGDANEEGADGCTQLYADADGDAYGGEDGACLCAPDDSFSTVTAGDCDDGDAAVYPDAPETCDGLDNDCDGDIDEDAVDASVWYGDVDGDGYGDLDDATIACEAPTDAVADATDCDDTDATANPGAVETCDGVDNDCDGSIDDGAVDAGTWYADADGDGYGGATVTGCSQPSGSVSNADDCYDGNADAYPGQTTYFDLDRGDGSFDYDCDGVETAEYTSYYYCYNSSGTTYSWTEGWDGGPPACGSAGSLVGNGGGGWASGTACPTPVSTTAACR